MQPLSREWEFMKGKFAIFGAAGAVARSIAATLRAQGIAFRVIGLSRRDLESSASPFVHMASANWCGMSGCLTGYHRAD
jgi:hypothetical protein